MTILGRHTVAETDALGKAIDYQFNQVDEGYRAISPVWKQAHTSEYDKLTSDWKKAVSDWHIDYEKVKAKLTAIVALAGLATPNDIIPSEDQYNTLLSHTAQGGRNGPDSLYDCAQRVQDALGRKIDYSGQPSQLDNTDVDQGALKAADAAKKGVETGTKSITPYLIGGGIILVGGVIVGKVYL